MATSIEIVEQVVSILLPNASAELRNDLDYGISQIIPSALRLLAEDKAYNENPQQRRLFQKTFTVTLTDDPDSEYQIADLSTLINAASQPMVLTLPFAGIRQANGEKLYFVADRLMLDIKPDDDDLSYFTIEDETIYAKNASDTQITIIAPYVPDLATLPRQVVPELVDYVIRVLRERKIHLELERGEQEAPRARSRRT